MNRVILRAVNNSRPLLGTLGAVALFCGTAAAEEKKPVPKDNKTEVVDADFEKGVKAYAKRDYPVAEQFFELAWARRKTHDTAANLGLSELRQQKFREAAEHLRFAVKTVPPSEADRPRSKAASYYEEAMTHVGGVHVSVNIEGAVVMVDGAVVGKAPLPQEVYLDPGEHKVEAQAQGKTAKAVQTEVTKGAIKEVAIVLSDAPVVAAAPSAAPIAPPVDDTSPPPAEPASESDDKTKVRWLFAGGGVSAVALVTGIALHLTANSKNSEVADLTAQMQDGARSLRRSQAYCPGHTECEERRAAVDGRDKFMTAAIVTYAVAGAVAAATVTYGLWPSVEKTAVSVVPAVSPETASVVLRGSF